MDANQLLSQRVGKFILRNVARDELMLEIMHPILKLIRLGVGEVKGLNILDMQLRVVIEVLEQIGIWRCRLGFRWARIVGSNIDVSLSFGGDSLRLPLLVARHFGDREIKEKGRLTSASHKISRKQAQNNVFVSFSLPEPPRVSTVSQDVIKSGFPVDPPNLLCSSSKASSVRTIESPWLPIEDSDLTTLSKPWLREPCFLRVASSETRSEKHVSSQT